MKRLDAVAERQLRKFEKRLEQVQAHGLTDPERSALRAGARMGYLTAKREDAANLDGQAEELRKALPRAEIMSPLGAKSIERYIRILEVTADTFRREPNEEISEPENREAIHGDDEEESESKAGNEEGEDSGARAPEGEARSEAAEESKEDPGRDRDRGPGSGLKPV